MGGQFPQLSFVGMGDYAPYEGGNHGFVPQEGTYRVKITSVEPEMAKDGIKAMVKVGCVIQDTDVGTGTPLINRVLYSGTDRNGKPLVRQFCDFLHSTGTPAANIQQFGAQGAAMPIEQAVAQLIGRDAYVQIKFEPYNGQLQSNIANWISKELYEKAVNSNSHRGRKADQVNIAQLAAATAGGGATAGGAVGAVNLGGPGLTVAQPAAAAAPAGNAMVPNL